MFVCSSAGDNGSLDEKRAMDIPGGLNVSGYNTKKHKPPSTLIKLTSLTLSSRRVQDDNHRSPNPQHCKSCYFMCKQNKIEKTEVR